MDEKLASLLYSYPVIWNRKHKYFKDKLKKQEAFKNLAVILRATPEIVESRYWALREKYRKEKVKLKQATEKDPNAEYDQWPLMQTLSFFDAVMTTRRTINSLGLTHVEPEQESESQTQLHWEMDSELKEEFKIENGQFHTDIQIKAEDLSDIEPAIETATSHVSTPPRLEKESSASNDCLPPETSSFGVLKKKKKDSDPTLDVLKRLVLAAESRIAQSTLPKTEDVYDAFGKFIAQSVRHLDITLREDVMLEIHQILHKFKNK